MNDLGETVDEKRDDSSVLCNDHRRIEWLDWTNCLYGDDVAVFGFNYAGNTTHQPNWPALLREDEIERTRRYHRSDDRLRSLYTRSLLRILVGKYTNRDPLSVQLVKGLGNKPELSDDAEWHMNAAHSGDWILLAIGKSSVGIDVEEVKPDFDFTDITPISFSTRERQYIEADGNALFRFYELWTRKEALVKAIGSGIDENFPLVPALTGFHKWETTKAVSAKDWIIESFHAAEGYPAALAHDSSVKHPRFYILDHRVFTSLSSS